MKLKIPLHKSQRAILNDKSKFRILVCSRRFGKSLLARWIAIIKALTSSPVLTGVKPVVLLCAPTMTQCLQVHWLELLSQLDNPAIKPHISRINHSDHRIDFTNNRASILLRGLDKGGSRLRGLKILLAIIDETQDTTREAFDQVISPALMDSPDSEVLFLGTPKGRQGFLYEMWLEGDTNPEISRHHYTVYDNPCIPLEKIEEQKKRLTPLSFKQELLASFEAPPGQIYDCLDERHIIEVSKDPNDYDAVYAGMDWGQFHPCIVIVGQKSYPAEYYIIDSWAPDIGISIPFDEHKKKAVELCTKYNVYSTFPDLYTPMNNHFIGELMQTGVPGLINIDVEAKKLDVMESNAVINSLFHQDRLFIDKNLTQLIDRFRSYHRKKDQHGGYLDLEALGQRCEESDSLRYVVCRVEAVQSFAQGLLTSLSNYAVHR